jgi:hypothetical protein
MTNALELQGKIAMAQLIENQLRRPLGATSAHPTPMPSRPASARPATPGGGHPREVSLSLLQRPYGLSKVEVSK